MSRDDAQSDRASATPNAEHAVQRSPSNSGRSWLLDGWIAWCWAVNVALFCGTLAWIWSDHGFMRSTVDPDRLTSVKFAPTTYIPMTKHRLWALRAVATAAAISVAFIVAGLFVGARRRRGLRSWLALVALVALWLAMATSWRDINWAGLRWRAAALPTAFESVAAPLRKHWPTEDGKTPTLGPFTAYPPGAPSMLMLLNWKQPAGSPVGFRAVGRSADGALRIQLSGAQDGNWLEWHPAGSQPASFRSGLDTSYVLDRASPLGDRWYLAKYHVQGLMILE